MTVIDQLKKIVGDNAWIDDPADMAPYLNEWRGAVVGKSPLVVLPDSTRKVSDLMRVCSETKTAVVPQGGNTGMCAGAVPNERGEEIVLALGRLNEIRRIDAKNFSMEVEAGCLLDNVQSAAKTENRHFAISLGSSGSCQIGGNLSTNAGGLNVLRYGTAREQVLGLEVVMADGTVINGLRALRKDTAGYDLKQLFVGSEGTLGVITAATLKLHPDPGETCTAMVAMNSGEDAIELLATMRNALHDVFEAFELISAPVLSLVVDAMAGFRAPMVGEHNWYVLMEVAVAEETLVEVLGNALNSGIIDDAVIAKSVSEAADFWRMRHSISEAERRKGSALKHDIAVPISSLAEFLSKGDALLAEIAPSSTLYAFGHVGDGNLHYNVAIDDGLVDSRRVSQGIYDLVHEFGGSFSAEHGIGLTKRSFLKDYRSKEELALMRTLKNALDPLNILNPGKVI